LKTIVLYLLMVGIPLLGVLMILKLGSGLKAPTSVGGDWQLAVADSPGCLLPGAAAEPTVLRITQSGADLQLSLRDQPGPKLAARLDGQSIRVVSTKREDILGLAAMINREAEPDQLHGEITLDGCAAPVSFSATRLPKTSTGPQIH
jgi:hypothetical protein